MRAIRLLFRDTLLRDNVRLSCALIGVSAAVALLVWTIGLAVTTWYQGRPMSERMGRPFDCWVATGRASAAAPKGSGIQSLTPGSPIKRIPQAVLDEVTQFEGITELKKTTVDRCKLDWRPDGRPVQGPGYMAGMASTEDFDACPYPDGLACGRWPTSDGTAVEFVVSPFAFGKEGLKEAPPLGTKIVLETLTGREEATLCGYLSEKIHPVSGFPTLFANLPRAADGYNLLLIRLQTMDLAETLANVVRTASPDDDAAKLVTRVDLLKQLRSDAVNDLSRQVPLLIILACIATFCMIMNALCIGIEQHRQRYARLRAIGMSVGQLARVVIAEAGFIASVGGVLGFGIGVGILAIFVALHPLIFPDGLHLFALTPLSTIGLLLLSTGCALIVPLRRVARLSPCELKVRDTIWRSAHPIVRLCVAVLLLLPIFNTLIAFEANPLMKSIWLLFIGLPTCITGLFLLVKPLMWCLERVALTGVSRCLGLHPAILRNSLLRQADRNTRMVLTLTAGLGSFFAIHLWGASLTEPFVPSKELPPAIVSILPNGVTARTAQKIEGVPFFAEQYPLSAADFDGIVQRKGVTPKQNNLLLIATEGEQGVTVTDMFARQCGFNVGDTLHLQRKDEAGKIYTLPLTITAIRQINWHLVTARAHLRAQNGAPMGTLGPIFVGAEVAQSFDPERAERVKFFWIKSFKETNKQALYSASELLEKQIQAVVDKDPLPPLRRGGNGARAGRPSGGGRQQTASNVTVHLRDEITEGTLMHSAELVGELAKIPLWSLLILCFGFISLLTANVNAMRGELLTLHAIGMTQGQMARMFYVQVILLTLTAIILSLIFALCIGWSFTGWTIANMPFGGLPTQLILPWSAFGQGISLLVLFIFVLTVLPIRCLLKRLLPQVR